MKKKEQKRFESTAFILLEVLAKAVEMKKLQLEEKKLDIDREMWLEKRSGQKVGSEVPKLKFPSGGFTENAENWTGKIVGTGLLNDEKEFVIPKSLFPIQGEKLTVVNDKPVSRNSNYKSLIQYLEESVKNGTIKSVNWDCGGFKGGMDFGQEDVQKMVFYDLNRLAKLPSEIHEEALENGLKTEKKCETASALMGNYKEGVWYKSIKSNAIQFNKKNGRGDGINDFGTVVKDANWLNSCGNGEWRIATEEESAAAFYKVFEND